MPHECTTLEDKVRNRTPVHYRGFFLLYTCLLKWLKNLMTQHIVVGPCTKGHFIHAEAFSGPGVLLLL
jgi:hypothetical protein